MKVVEEEKKAGEIEEEKKGSDLEKPLINPFEWVTINCLNKKRGTGATLIKCSHYSHYKCLTEYLTANESDARKRDLRKIIGLDFNTF